MLTFNFAAMTVFGIWCPPNWSPCQRIAYKIYLSIISTIMFSLVSCQLARLMFIKMNFDDFNDTFYFFLSTSCGCFKLVSNLIRHDEIVRLVGMFQEECCQVRDDFEDNVKKTYDKICRAIGLGLLVFVELTILLWLIGRTQGGIESRQLPYKILQLYDLSDPFVYWLSYAHHMFAGFLFAGIGMISDATITGFMLQLCGQLDILNYRVRGLPKRAQRMSRHQQSAEIFLLKENVIHHIHIYSMAQELESTFNGIISVQFFVSSMEICVSVYQLTVRSATVIDSLMNVFFIMCMLGQLSTYCFIGNVLATKSVQLADTLYNLDWLPLSMPFKKTLTFIILRSSKPINISSGAIVNLTMETFTSVVKFAYSAFNFLKTTT